jgi:DNA-directed RNA polymerase specialized sigma24 family protein
MVAIVFPFGKTSTKADQAHRALQELPDEQRYVFVAHEIEGLSFRQIAAATGANLNTLLSRKRYAVRHLRERLQQVYDDLEHRQGA